jgi:Ras-related protein Rab-8A
MTDGALKLMQYDHRAKVLLLGDSGVGKSSLIRKFIDGEFVPHIQQTIGMDYKVKILTLGGCCVKLEIWDTAGQERFRSITQQFYRNAGGIIMVYDVTDEKSFADIREWAAQIAAHAADGVDRILLGNKSDCEPSRRVVDAARGKALADEYGIPFMETCAKDGSNVEEAFITIADAVHKNSVIPCTASSSPSSSILSSSLVPNGSTERAEQLQRRCWCLWRRRRRARRL